jgi:predicted alpha/beta hydrolase
VLLSPIFCPHIHLSAHKAPFPSNPCSWLASQGVGVCTFDYRYFGLSFPPPYDAQSFTEQERQDALLTCPEDVKLTETWARKDMVSIIRYASEYWPDVPLVMLGNSLGGHLIILAPDVWPLITRFLNVGGGMYL